MYIHLWTSHHAAPLARSIRSAFFPPTGRPLLLRYALSCGTVSLDSARTSRWQSLQASLRVGLSLTPLLSGVCMALVSYVLVLRTALGHPSYLLGAWHSCL